MATRAHSTRTPLLPPPGATPRLLPRGLGRQPGPDAVAKRRPRRSASAFDPASAPDFYAMLVEGDCCAPEIPHGSHAMCSPNEPVRSGDFVVIYFTETTAEKVGCRAWIKRAVFINRPPQPGARPRYASNVEPCLCVEQLNPPRSYVIPWSEIEAVHRCLGQVPAHVRVTRPTATERRAWIKAHEGVEVAA